MVVITKKKLAQVEIVVRSHSQNLTDVKIGLMMGVGKDVVARVRKKIEIEKRAKR